MRRSFNRNITRTEYAVLVRILREVARAPCVGYTEYSGTPSVLQVTHTRVSSCPDSLGDPRYREYADTQGAPRTFNYCEHAQDNALGMLYCKATNARLLTGIATDSTTYRIRNSMS